MTRSFLIVALLSIAIGAPPLATAVEPGRWRFAKRWEDLTTDQRKTALENYRKHKGRSRQEQKTIEEQYKRWKRMPTNDKDRVRKRFKGPPRD